jgi:hypothetical protein
MHTEKIRKLDRVWNERTVWPLEDGRGYLFNWQVWEGQVIPVRIRCSACLGQTEVIEIECAWQGITIDSAEVCPVCHKQVTARVVFRDYRRQISLPTPDEGLYEVSDGDNLILNWKLLSTDVLKVGVKCDACDTQTIEKVEAKVFDNRTINLKCSGCEKDLSFKLNLFL